MPIKFAVRFTACCALVSLFSLLSTAQQTSPSSSSDPSAQTQSQPPAAEQKTASAQQSPPDKTPHQGKDSQDASGQSKAASNDRLGFALPNFLTVQNGAQVTPLNSKQKFQVVGRGSFDYANFVWYGVLSGISQAENSEPGFGQGAKGFGKRYASTWADGVIENFMVGAVLPSVFHQDPRFYQMGQGAFGNRFGYSATRVFVTRGDSGHRQFNASEVLGSAMSACISTFSYHPHSTILSTPSGPMFIPSDRTLPNAAKVWGTQLGYDAGTIALKEFWPDIHRKLSHKHKSDNP